MDQILGFILGLAVGGVVVWFFLNRKTSQGEATPASDKSSAGQADEATPASGEANQFEKKEENLKKILELFKERSSRITNNDVENFLKVSDSTATRYLDELEKQGKIKQVGKTGHYTYYQKI